MFKKNKNVIIKKETIEQNDECLSNASKELISEIVDETVNRFVRQNLELIINKAVSNSSNYLEDEFIKKIIEIIIKLEKIRVKFLKGINENKNLLKQIEDESVREQYTDINNINLKRFDCEDLQGVLNNIHKKSDNDDGAHECGFDF